MKAAIRSKIGDPGVLSLQELEIPVPKNNEAGHMITTMDARAQ
ncbi:MAG: hypothetical protein WDO71_23110 [Bacteroidota bacterium]